MKARGTGRFIVALLVCLAAAEVSLARVMALGHAVLGDWGLVAGVIVLGFGLALLYTAVYDGPLALGRLLTGGSRWRSHHRSQADQVD